MTRRQPPGVRAATTRPNHARFITTTVTSEHDLVRWNDVRNAGDPHDASPLDVARTAWRRPRRVYVLASSDGGANDVAAAQARWKDDLGSAWLRVVRAAPDTPIESLTCTLDALETHLGAAGVTGTRRTTWTYDHQEAELAALEARGFVETGRRPVIGLDVAASSVPSPMSKALGRSDLTLTTLGDRPDLVDAVWRTYRDSWSNAPWGDADDVLPCDEWWANIAQWPGSGPDNFLAAIDRTGAVVAYGELDFGAMPDPSCAWHGYTGVRPEHQGVGIGTAMKRALVAWARARGVELLLAANDEPNVAMRRINEQLGYRRRFAYVSLERPAKNGR